MAKEPEKPVPRIVEAVGIASSAGKKNVAKLIEAAMSQAVTDAMAEGVNVNDSDELRKRMMAARQKVLDQHNKEVADASAAERLKQFAGSSNT